MSSSSAVARPRGYDGVAWNPATASENRIHSDAVARQYGFRGGLVPGVTVYACMVEPAVRAWGLDWLSRGSANVVLRKPVYEGGAFRVDLHAVGDRWTSGLRDGAGIVCAEGELLERSQIAPPKRRGDPPVPKPEDRPEATREALEALRERGMGALALRWDGAGENGRYRESPADMPDLVRPDRAGWAHPGFTLGLANGVLSRNVRLGPWIHVESRVHHHAPLALGTDTLTEARVTNLFERRGHEFVDLEVAVFGAGDAPILSAFHRSIYRLRPSG